MAVVECGEDGLTDNHHGSEEDADEESRIL